MPYGEKYFEVNVGFSSLVPPLLAMGLALTTKEVVSSLIIGSISAVIIYSIAVLNGMVPGLEKANPVDVLFTVMGEKIGSNIYIVLFILLMGGLIQLITMSGGSQAYGRWAQKVVRGRKPALVSTFGLGCFMFLDDYFNAITTGTVMRTVTDVNSVSKPKLAYIVHTIASNMCITIPLSSWAAAIVAQIDDSGVEDSFVVFLSTIPYHLYSLLSFIMILCTIIFDFDYGKMKFYEDNAKRGLSDTDGSIDKSTTIENPGNNDRGSIIDLLIPILVLIVLSIYFMLYLGGFFDGTGKTLNQALYDTSAPKALLYACFFSLITSLCLYVPRKIMNFRDWMEHFKEGMKTMIPTITILVLAWTISGTSGDLLQTGMYVGDLVAHSPIPPQMIPAVIFFVGVALSFSMGTAWGTFGILIPIVVKICSGESRKYLPIALSACLCGSVFGDNTSPISDTTILASSSTQCSFLVHVSTQLPYAATIACISIIGYIVAGFSESIAITWIVALALFAIIVFFMLLRQKKMRVNTLDLNTDDGEKEKATEEVVEETVVEVDDVENDNDAEKKNDNEVTEYQGVEVTVSESPIPTAN